MIFVCRKIYHMDFPITNFDNIIFGMATAKNIDISKAILWYAAYVLPLCFLFAWAFKKSYLYDKAKNFFANLKAEKDESTVFLMTLLLSFMILCEHDFITLLCAVCFAVMSLFGRNDEVAVTSWLSSLYIFSTPIFCLSRYFGDSENIFIIFAVVSSIFFCLKKDFSTIFAKLYPFLIAGISSLILLNVIEILLVRGYPLSENFSILPYILAAAFCIFVKPNLEKNYERKILRGTIILMILSDTPALGVGGYINFFEISNHGLSIQDFVNYGEFPLINNLDAHMLEHTLSGLIWFALTGDYIGAIYSPYCTFIQDLLGVPAFFYLLTKFFTERQSFIILVFFPFSKLLYTLPGLAILPLFIFWKNNPNFFRSLIVHIIISAICLYRIDLGASFGFALFATPILFCLIKKNCQALTDYFFAAVLWAAIFFAVVFFGLHFEFAEDFLTAFNSNQHWAYGDLGETNRVIFVYFILPAITAILFLPVVRRILNKDEIESDWLILLLYLTFIFSVTRIMVRHTLTEFNSYMYAVEFFLLALLIISFCKVHKATIFIGASLILYVVCGNCAGSLSAFTGLKNLSVIIYSIHLKQPQYFTYFTEEDSFQIERMKNFFYENLHDDETYFDFTNQALFFVFTERKNPVYINQCPAMINGVKGQLQALDDLKKSKVKFVVKPYLQRPNVPYSAYYEIDGILNCDRYYLLTEWLCKNYQPYQPVGNFYAWKLKDDVPADSLNYNYEAPEYHLHNLGFIPQLLGKSAIQSEIIELPATENGLRNLKNVTGKTGFISMEISSDSDEEVQFKIKGNEINDVVYRFKITEGTHVYRFRVSSEILWYSGKLETLDAENFHADKIYFEELKE